MLCFSAGNNGSKVDEWTLMTGNFGNMCVNFNFLIKNRAKFNNLIHKRTNPISLHVSLLKLKSAAEQGNFVYD